MACSSSGLVSGLLGDGAFRLLLSGATFCRGGMRTLEVPVRDLLSGAGSPQSESLRIGKHSQGEIALYNLLNFVDPIMLSNSNLTQCLSIEM